MSKDGGSAFPLPLGTMNEADPNESGGMSLRDWLAGQAVVGLLSAGRHRPEDASRLAYVVADLMLAERHR